MVCEKGDSYVRPFMESDGWGGDIRRGLFDKQTCYPIRRWRRVQEEEPQAPLISCCYEANGLD